VSRDEFGTDAEGRIATLREDVERATVALGRGSSTTVNLRVRLGHELVAAGHAGIAREEFAQAASDAEAAFGPRHLDTLLARYEHLMLIAMSAPDDGVVAELAVLLDDHLEMLGAYDHRTLAVRSALAAALMRIGRVEAADQQLEMLLMEAEHEGVTLEAGQRANWLLHRVLAKQRLHDPVAALELAVAAREAAVDPEEGDPAMALNAMAKIVEVVASALGSDDDSEGPPSERFVEGLRDAVTELTDMADVEAARGALPVGGPLWTTVQLARLEAAVALDGIDASVLALHRLIDDLRLLRGLDDAVLTVATRIGEQLGEAGRVDEAIAFIEAMLLEEEHAAPDATEALLILRNNLGQWLAVADRMEESIAVLRATVDQAASVLDPADPQLATMVRNLVARALDHGDMDTAASGLEMLESLAEQADLVEQADLAERADLGGPAGPAAERPGGTAEVPTPGAGLLVALAGGSTPRPAAEVAAGCAAAARLGRHVYVERRAEGWCWSVTGTRMDELERFLRQLDTTADALPDHVLGSGWIVRDGRTTWRPSTLPGAPEAWWVFGPEEASDPASVTTRIGG
jgi:tetratricopeptide (TPR) repeat protein